MGYYLNFLSNNVNGLNSSKKQIKMFEYCRKKIANNGILFLQETHSPHDAVIYWRDDFKGGLLFSHGTTNSCGVIYLRINKIKVNAIKNDNQGRVVREDADIDEETFVVVNFYNANTARRNKLKLFLSSISYQVTFVQILTKNNTFRGFQFIL